MPLQPTLETVKALQAIAEELFEQTSADRTTIRVETPNDPDYPVLAEARAPGVSSLTGGMCLKGYKPYDIHTTATLRHLKTERKMIVQRDARVDPPAIPMLPEVYGVSSQILTPLVHADRLVGIVSVHAIDPRDWSEADVAAMEEATRRVEDEIARGTWVAM